jgi:hypothetical protein
VSSSAEGRFYAGIFAALLATIGLSFLEPSATVSKSSGTRGLRAFAADVKWISAYRAWQNHDEVRLKRDLTWATKLAPSNTLFWLEGARMLGYDVAAWRRAEVGQRAEFGRVNRAAFESAQTFLAEAEKWHPTRSALPIEEAIMQSRLAGDASASEQSLARAQECADAPYFAARIRAELLVQLGREREGLQILEAEYAQLPKTDPRAMAEVVADRIADLRARLGESG